MTFLPPWSHRQDVFGRQSSLLISMFCNNVNMSLTRFQNAFTVVRFFGSDGKNARYSNDSGSKRYREQVDVPLPPLLWLHLRLRGLYFPLIPLFLMRKFYYTPQSSLYILVKSIVNNRHLLLFCIQRVVVSRQSR